MKVYYLSFRRIASIKGFKSLLYFLIPLNVLAIVLDAIVLSLIYPLLTAVTNTSTKNIPLIILGFDEFSTENIAIFVVSIVFVAGVTKVVSIYFTNKKTAKIGAEVACQIFHKYVSDYEYAKKIRSAEIVSAVTIKATEFISGTCQAFINGFSAFLALVLYLIIIAQQFKIELLVSLLLVAGVFLLFVYLTKTIMSDISNTVSKGGTSIVNTINETKRAIREVRSLGLDNKLTKRFNILNNNFRNAQANAITLSLLPKTVIEPLVLIMAILMLVTIDSDTGDSTVPVQIAALGYSLSKLLPYCQQMYSSVTNLRGARSSVSDLVMLFYANTNERKFLTSGVEIIESVKLHNISYAYDKHILFKDVSFDINRGDSILITGHTGSGKSTLTDLISGLIKPNSGLITINGIEYSAAGYSIADKVAFVGQRVFISCGTIYENIVLGVKDGMDNEEIMDRVRTALYITDLENYVATLPNGLDYFLEEDGVNISGGQRQRIGIARALVADRPIIIFDESFNALDAVTAARVSDRLFRAQCDKIYLLIAHDNLVQKNCNKLLKIANSEISVSLNLERTGAI